MRFRLRILFLRDDLVKRFTYTRMNDDFTFFFKTALYLHFNCLKDNLVSVVHYNNRWKHMFSYWFSFDLNKTEHNSFLCFQITFV